MAAPEALRLTGPGERSASVEAEAVLEVVSADLDSRASIHKLRLKLKVKDMSTVSRNREVAQYEKRGWHG